MEWTKGTLKVSDDKSLIQIESVYRWLQASYWASDRDLETIQATLDHSLVFGLYDGEQQIGFARAVSDKVVFSWLMDVVIDEDYRGKGLGKWFLSCLLQHPDLKDTRMGLATKDAHTFYERFGFKRQETMRQTPKSNS